MKQPEASPPGSGPLLLKDGWVLDESGSGLRAADVLIDAGRIAAVGPSLPEAGRQVVRVPDRLILPGFFNAHYHSHDVLLKGSFEPAPLELWVLNALPRSYGERPLEEIRVRTLLGAAECLRSGITTVQDMLTLSPLSEEAIETVLRAYEDIGIRVVMGLQVADVPPIDTVPFWRETVPEAFHAQLGAGAARAPVNLDTVERFLGERGGSALRTWALAPSSPERCSPELLGAVADLAARHALPVYSHIYISRAEALNARHRYASQGGSLVSVLEDAGLLNERLSLAHGVWLDEREIARLARAGASVVLNPVSNLKSKNGAPPIRALHEAGVNLALGCDNCSCTDVQNMFQAMKLASLLAAISEPRPGPPAAPDLLRAATVGGARTAGLAGQLGEVSPGMLADLALIDLSDPAYLPLNDCARQLVYSETGRGVESVLVGGRFVVRDRRIVTLDESRLRDAVNDAMDRFRPEARRVRAFTERLAPHLLEADRRMWECELPFGRYIGRSR